MKEALYGLAQALRAQSRVEEAKPYFDLAHLQQQAKTEANLGPGLNERGLQFLKSGQLKQAEESFREALTVAPSFGHAAHNLAVVLARTGKTSEAIEAFKLAISLRPTLAAAYAGLAALLKETGDPSADKVSEKAKLLKEVAPQPEDLVFLK
jgi:tetratricopeptide (TPR) repeat protein